MSHYRVDAPDQHHVAPYEQYSFEPQRKSSKRPLLVIAIAAAVALLVGVAIGAYSSLRTPSPGDEVKAYLTALQRNDIEQAYSHLSESSKKSVGSPKEMSESAIGGALRNGMVESFTIARTTTEGNTALVEVKMRNGINETTTTIRTVKENGRWRIAV